MILLAQDLGDVRQPILGVMDIGVRRNAFGPSSTASSGTWPWRSWRAPSRAVFIRAPAAEQLGEVVETLADGTPVAVRRGGLLASTFHPERGEDARIHRMFLELRRAGRPWIGHAAAVRSGRRGRASWIRPQARRSLPHTLGVCLGQQGSRLLRFGNAAVRPANGGVGPLRREAGLADRRLQGRASPRRPF